MTIETLEYVRRMIKEGEEKGGSMRVGTAWRYTHASTKKEAYAVFLLCGSCDIFTSPYVKDPVLVYSVDEGWT